MLAKAHNELGEKLVYEIMNPKAVKNDELYGWLSASTGGILTHFRNNLSCTYITHFECRLVRWYTINFDEKYVSM